MPQDAFTLSQSAKELNKLLSGAKINKVSQPDKDDVYLLTYSSIGSKTLVLSSNAENCRISFISKEKTNPKVAPNFCMLLRKHLLGASIEKIELMGTERIIAITFLCKNDFKDSVTKILYAEIMGKYSNLILTENGLILGCLKNAPLDVATTRVTLSGAEYKFPKPQDKAELTNESEAISRLSAFSGEDLGNFIFNNFKGFSYQTANEFAHRCGDERDPEKLYRIIYDLYFNPPIKPNIAGEGKLRDFYAFDYLTVGGEKTYFDTIAEGQDVFYTSRDVKKGFELKQKQLLDKINGLIKKNTKKLQGENEKILSCQNLDELKLKGELITAYIYKIKEGESEVTVENYYDDMKPMKITLDKNLTPSKNAQRYFKKYAKEKRALEIVVPQKEQTEKELEYLNSVRLELLKAETVADFEDIENELMEEGVLPKPKFRKKQEKETPYRVYDVDGYVVKCGKNNIQNDRLTARAFKDDLWLHTKAYHSSHVIIETKGGKIPDNVIVIAAEICAYYSDAQGGSKVPVDFTEKKHVKKPPKAKAGSVIYTDQQTILVSPSAHTELLKV